MKKLIKVTKEEFYTQFLAEPIEGLVIKARLNNRQKNRKADLTFLWDAVPNSKPLGVKDATLWSNTLLQIIQEAIAYKG